MNSVNRARVKNFRRERKANLKADNKKMSKNVKKYHDTYEI